LIIEGIVVSKRFINGCPIPVISFIVSFACMLPMIAGDYSQNALLLHNSLFRHQQEDLETGAIIDRCFTCVASRIKNCNLSFKPGNSGVNKWFI
jgi:hypothetical protein